MSGFDTVIFEKTGHIARVILNRPRELNAFNIKMRDDLFEILCAIKMDNEIRVVILSGKGEKAFCAGADLSEFLTAPPPVKARRVRFRRDLWSLFLSLPQPTIAAVYGFVLGSGLEMALCCDIRIASDDAKFGLPEVGLGIIPAAGGTQTLPRAIGQSKAMEMLLSNKWIDSEEAQAFRLINRIVKRDKLMEHAEILAEKIASHDPAAVQMAKQAIVRGMDMTLVQGLNLEKELSMKLRGMRIK
ncbi:MAG: enoyl-CoA hydratase/isomerase family protein [Deltaproteobacteria bacterium]|nr:enoyl-CoA hydratase/isomerase family protein [Deltaproteobacteria bacterium]